MKDTESSIMDQPLQRTLSLRKRFQGQSECLFVENRGTSVRRNNSKSSARESTSLIVSSPRITTPFSPFVHASPLRLPWAYTSIIYTLIHHFRCLPISSFISKVGCEKRVHACPVGRTDWSLYRFGNSCVNFYTHGLHMPRK